MNKSTKNTTQTSIESQTRKIEALNLKEDDFAILENRPCKVRLIYNLDMIHCR